MRYRAARNVGGSREILEDRRRSLARDRRFADLLDRIWDRAKEIFQSLDPQIVEEVRREVTTGIWPA
ncbi:MAG TPA: hypothetical protein VHL58_02300 [Thermoanaerobaculia bacterium]|nr:hypothetical protein [Thermoanaerobaculia bacterium]